MSVIIVLNGRGNNIFRRITTFSGERYAFAGSCLNEL
jgi:hypothetical protein